MHKKIIKAIEKIKIEYDYWPTASLLWECGIPEYNGDAIKLAVFKKTLVLMREVQLIMILDMPDSIRIALNPLNKKAKIDMLEKRLKEEALNMKIQRINSTKQINLFGYEDE